MKQTIRNAIDTVAVPIVLGLGGLALTTAMDLSAMALQAGLEAVLPTTKQEYVATFKEKQISQLAQTKGSLYTGIFVLPNGKQIELVDGAQILNGKLFPNTIVPSLKEGRRYSVNANILSEKQGIGYLVSAKELN